MTSKQGIGENGGNGLSDVDESDRIVTAAIRRIVGLYGTDEITDTADQESATGNASIVLRRLAASSERIDGGMISSTLRSRLTAWSAEELADLIGVSKQHIYKLAKALRMPSHRVGGAVRFDPHLIAEWWDKKATG
jgi:excisionase family DNA binding protein